MPRGGAPHPRGVPDGRATRAAAAAAALRQGAARPRQRLPEKPDQLSVDQLSGGGIAIETAFSGMQSSPTASC